MVKKVFGSRNDREIKRITELYVGKINAFEEATEKLNDEELVANTAKFRERHANGESLESLLPEAFATARTASMRVLGMRHFDVQLVGGVVLHEGKIAEMKTGEGKTLVATLPVYLNGLTGNGVHVVTVNDYLAERDSEWMGQLYRFLGLSVGVVKHGITEEERKDAYNCDITYATNNELGFDYLRDNMKFTAEDCVQRKLSYAIVDEVDSILIDEARTPLIISGPAEKSTDLYYKVNQVAPLLMKKDELYTVDEKAKAVMLTEEGIAVAEKALSIENLYDPAQIDTLHHVQQAIKAHVMFKLDVDYVVKDGEVIIVDEFTGRLMPGRRWSDGLHQAVEAKEGVKIENENQTLATITFQNFFRMYDKLSGMTGTADTESAEFANIYDLEVMVIPTNRPMARLDMADQIYMTVKEKDGAIINEIEVLHEKGQPVLVGTISIEKSETLSYLLKKRKIKHNVLNAKHHEQEAEIVAQAGRLGAVTIATNMAGRGTDIVLGGNPELLASEKGIDPEEGEYAEIAEQCKTEHEEVIKAGGLHIIGTERHESRRIDNQLRGRSGRQGDPGSSRFYLSLEDDLLRIFGSERLAGIMDKLGIEEGEPIEAKMVTKAIANAQKKVEGHNFDIRKHLLEYDDVMNAQREIIYDQRKMIFEGDELHETILDMVLHVMEDDLALHANETLQPEEWEFEPLKEIMGKHFALHVGLDKNKNMTIENKTFDFETVTHETLLEFLTENCHIHIDRKKRMVGDEMWSEIERYITLNIVDANWKDHLLSMDYLKEGVGLRGYAQKNPLHEYKKEGMALFNEMMVRIREDVVSALCHVKVESQEEGMLRERQMAEQQREQASMVESLGDRPQKKEPVKRSDKKVGRNDPCPCGSGKKYKKCHGAN